MANNSRPTPIKRRKIKAKRSATVEITVSDSIKDVRKHTEALIGAINKVRVRAT